jgi:hypothetical protein
MHPYTSSMMVDIAPNAYNTNPLADRGGYEHNLASFNGTRPLATILDENRKLHIVHMKMNSKCHLIIH